MKRFLALAVLTTLFTALIPVALSARDEDTTEETQQSLDETAETTESASAGLFSEETVQVFSHIDNTTSEMAMRDYIIGVVAAEMPVEYEKEALKAQALAAISYTRYTIASGKESISTDSGVNQGYRSETDMRADWGDKYEENYNKIRQAVTEVENLSLEYEGEPILAAYFALSAGRTEDAENIWGKEYAYLKAVPSDGDALSPGFETDISVTADELMEKLKIKTDLNPKDYIGEITATDTGSVTGISVCGESFTGEELRAALALPSPVFTVSADDEIFTFHCKGCGHGVGMSQYGADYMARQGANFAEILLHYYTGAQIVQRNIATFTPESLSYPEK